MMNFRRGINFALITAVISGIAIFLNGFAVKAVGDPLVFTTVKNLGVALVIGALLIVRSLRGQIAWKKIGRKEWFYLLTIGIIGGSLPFYLFFKGLSLADSSSASFIHKTLVFWVALWALPMLKEKITVKQVGALLLVFAGSFLFGGIKTFQWGLGETMVLAATILWAIENIVAKHTLKTIDVDVVVGARMIFGSIILFGSTILGGKVSMVTSLTLQQWLLTLVTIGFLTGYVMTWYRALRFAPATLVATVLTLGTVITNVLSALFITHTISVEMVYQNILLFGGVWFFVITSKKLLTSPNRQLNLTA